MKKNNKLPITTRIRFWIIMQMLPVRLRSEFIKQFFTDADKFLISRGLDYLADAMNKARHNSSNRAFDPDNCAKDGRDIMKLRKAFETENYY